MASDVVRPIFILGVGRSGSSVFFQILARHPELAWLSRAADSAPGRDWVQRGLMRAVDHPWLLGWATRYADPSEAYHWWDQRFPGFSEPCRDLVAADASLKVSARVRRDLAALLTRRRHRALVKITGWPRIGFLQAIFPDALFIHVLRDGRPVSNSFLNVDWWLGWRGPHNWLWGDLSPAHQAEWEKHGRSFVALAGIQWKILMDAVATARTLVPADRFLEIRYEDLCQEPAATYRRACDFAGLTFPSSFERAVVGSGLRSENEKWRRDFTPEQQQVLESVLAEALIRYGYRPGAA